jgi:hypothetical protein
MDICLRFPIRLHGLVLNYLIKYKDNFTLLLLLQFYCPVLHFTVPGNRPTTPTQLAISVLWEPTEVNIARTEDL